MECEDFHGESSVGMDLPVHPSSLFFIFTMIIMSTGLINYNVINTRPMSTPLMIDG